MPTTRNAIMRNVLQSAIYLIFFMMSIVLFVLGPKIEALLHPVISGFEIQRIWQEADSNGTMVYFAEGIILKTRGECEPTDVLIYANGGAEDKSSKPVHIETPNDPRDNEHGLIDSPVGAQHWGPWRFYPPSEPLGPIINIAVRHRCHSLWQQTQIIYTGLTNELFPGLELDTLSGE